MVQYCYFKGKRTEEMTERKRYQEEAEDFNPGGRCHRLAQDAPLLQYQFKKTSIGRHPWFILAHSQGIIDCNALAVAVAIFFSIWRNTNVSPLDEA